MAKLTVWGFSLGSLLVCAWVVIHWAGMVPPQPFGPERALIVFFSDRLLGAVPGLFPLVIGAYAVSVCLASTLALVLVSDRTTNRAALLLGVSLGSFSFFAAQFVLMRRIPLAASNPVGVGGNCLAMVAFAWGCWAMLQFAFSYPQLIDVAAYSDFQQKRRRALRATSWWHRLMPAGRSLDRVNERAEFATDALRQRQIAFLRASWWPWGLGLFGVGLVVAENIFGPGRWLVWPGFLLLALPFITLGPLSFEVLHWQYRTGVEQDRVRITWLYFGLVVAGWSVLILQTGPLVWLAFGGGGETAGKVWLCSMCLEVPLLAILLVLLLACSIFFFGAINPRLAIRKTSLYGIAAMLLTVTVAVMQGTAATQLVQRLGLPGNFGFVFAAAMVGLVFAPLRGRIEAGVERVVERMLPANALAQAHRETVTVVFGDMSGYTELSARDEPTALTLASLLHKESRRLAERHGGRLVKTIGDAVLLAFPDPAEAVLACQELRDAVAAAAGALKLPALPLHFGLHHGEVVCDQDGDVFGGTVNLAARLQGQAAAGEIVASATVASALPLGDFTVEALGERKLKNVPGLVPCHRIA